MDIKANPHPVYRGIFVTDDGRIFQELKASPGYCGYHTVKVKTAAQGKGQTIRRHTLVLEAFHGLGNGRVARHKDGNPGNDHKDNLQWGTQAENSQDTVDHGRSTKGEKNAQAKLTKEQVHEIRERYARGESGSSLGAEFGISQPNVVDIAKRRTWKHI